MSTPALVLLGVVAFASLVQAVFLVVVAREGLRLARRLDDMQERLARELRPAVERLTRATEDAAQAASITTAQVRRLEGLVEETAASIDDAQRIVGEIVVPTATRLVTVAAAVQAIRRGVGIYRRLTRR
jgi:hypothetical protein